VVILDFIGNYKKANNIRKHLSKGQKEQKNEQTGRVEKIIYEYSPNCEVHFDAEVEQILDRQDSQEREITKEDLIAAYYTLAEKLEHKPTPEEINTEGEFKISKYLSVFGSWIKFLREIGEFTEASYHFPQGLHLGHLLFVVKTILSNNLKNTHLDDNYVKLRGGFAEGRVGTFQRQTKFKLQGLMELGLILDDRELEEFKLEFTPKGKKFAELLNPLLNRLDLTFKDKDGDIPSWEMNLSTQHFNNQFFDFIKDKPIIRQFVENTFLNMHAVNLMLNYLYRIERKATINKSDIYESFFKAPFVKIYCDQNGIEVATDEGAKHRCPYLLNILESIGIITQSRNDITIQRFIASKQTLQLKSKETEIELEKRIEKFATFAQSKKIDFSEEEISMLKENFGKEFLTNKYFLTNFEIVK